MALKSQNTNTDVLDPDLKDGHSDVTFNAKGDVHRIWTLVVWSHKVQDTFTLTVTMDKSRENE